MAKWIDKPGLSAGQLADGDKMLLGDVSEAVGSRDKTVTLGDLRAFLGAGVTVGVTQASHGLSVGDVVRHNGTSYVAATADTGANAQVVGIVTSVPDANSFAFQATGLVTVAGASFTPGALYYLQDASGLGTSPGTVEKPILIAVSSTSGVLVLAIGASGGGATSLGDLDDVDTSGAQDGDALTFDADLSMWVPGAGGGGGGGIDPSDGLVVVQHGAVAATARPTAGVVYWMGSVAPNNKQTGDLWLETGAFD